MVIAFVACDAPLPMTNDKLVTDVGAASAVKVRLPLDCVAVHVAPFTPLLKMARFASICTLPLLYDLIGVNVNVIFLGASPATC